MKASAAYPAGFAKFLAKQHKKFMVMTSINDDVIDHIYTLTKHHEKHMIMYHYRLYRFHIKHWVVPVSTFIQFAGIYTFSSLLPFPGWSVHQATTSTSDRASSEGWFRCAAAFQNSHMLGTCNNVFLDLLWAYHHFNVSCHIQSSSSGIPIYLKRIELQKQCNFTFLEPTSPEECLQK